MPAQPFTEPDRSQWPDGEEYDELYEAASRAFDRELDRRIDDQRECRHDRWDDMERQL